MIKSILLPLTILTTAMSLTASAQGIWTTVQGNSAHTGFVNIKTNPANFHVLWSKQLYINRQTVDNGAQLASAVVTSDKLAYFDISYYYRVPARNSEKTGERLLMAIEQNTGNTSWILKRDPTMNFTSIAYDNDKILSFRTIYDNVGVDVIRPDTGQIDFTIPVENADYQYNGLLADHNKIYPSFNRLHIGKLYSMDASTGKIDWVSQMSNDTSYTDKTPVATPDYIVYNQYNGISVYDRQTGQFKFDITNPDYYGTSLPMFLLSTPIYDAANNAIYEGYRYVPNGQWFLAAFDLTNKKIKWTTPIENGNDGYPALAGNDIYIVAHAKGDDGELQTLDPATGNIKWSWHPDTEDNLRRFSYPIVTADLIFIQSYKYIYAISRQTHQKVWEYASTGNMAIGNNILFITDRTSRKVPDSDYYANTGIMVTAIALA